jgi:hypothetical protein
VLHLAPAADGTRVEMRVRSDDVDAASVTRAWGASLAATDVEGWLRLARFAREKALFDLADRGFARAADASTVAKEHLEAFRAARPAEESRHHFEIACEAFRADRHARAADAARACIAAHETGPDAVMAQELLDLLDQDAPAKTPSQAKADAAAARELKRLEAYAARGEARLSRPTRGSRAAAINSATRLLGDVSERLEKLVGADIDPATRRRATELREQVDGHRVNGLLHLADLALQAGADRTSLSAIHDVLAIRPDEPLALDLRQRVLDSAEQERERERDALWSGRRRTYHAHPYVARDVHSGLGLVPTWDPIRGLGKIPYSGRWWRDDGGAVVVRRRVR